MLCCRNVVVKSAVLVQGRGSLLRSAKGGANLNHAANVAHRNVSFNAMEKAVGQYAANTFIESMNLDSRAIVRTNRFCLVPL
jgi:hypothetical protein